MTSLEAYNSFLIKLNRADSNSNINVPRGKFVIVFNEQAKKWLKEKLKRKLSSDEVNELSALLADDQPLKLKKKNRDNYSFEKPSNFFSFASSYSVAKKGDCEKVLDNWDTKSKDIRVLLRDENNKPSFDYEETLLKIAGSEIKVYFDDFQIKQTFLSYYKEPKNIDIAGYININGEPSKTINPELPDIGVNEIISRCVREFTGITENPQGFAIAKDRITNEE